MATSSSDFAKSLFTTGRFSDFEIRCGGYVFPVHKSFLFARSGYFRALFTSGMKETTDGKVIFEDLDPGRMARLLLFCYNQEEIPLVITKAWLPQSCHDLEAADKKLYPVSDSFARAFLAIDMYVLSMRFDVPDLVIVAERIFCKALKELGHDDSTPRSMVNQEECSRLIRLVYATTITSDTAFRKEILAAITRLFMDSKHRMDEWRYLVGLVEEIPELSKDIAIFFLSQVPVNNTEYIWPAVTIHAHNREFPGHHNFYSQICFRTGKESTIQDVINFCREQWAGCGELELRYASYPEEPVKLSNNVPVRNLGLVKQDSLLHAHRAGEQSVSQD